MSTSNFQFPEIQIGERMMVQKKNQSSVHEEDKVNVREVDVRVQYGDDLHVQVMEDIYQKYQESIDAVFVLINKQVTMAKTLLLFSTTVPLPAPLLEVHSPIVVFVNEKLRHQRYSCTLVLNRPSQVESLEISF
jgi:hypothetical protein